MELKEFVADTLDQIARGIEEANKRLSLKRDSRSAFFWIRGRPDMPEEIAFDVAVTVSESKQKSGAAGIKVYAVELGRKKGSAASSESVSRISFKVAVAQDLA